MKSIACAATLFLLAGWAPAQASHDCPYHAEHTRQAATPPSAEHDDREFAAMNERGDRGMGFRQSATIHHFLSTPEGGIIRVEAKHAADQESRDAVRSHLAAIAKAFAAGDFSIPSFVHDQTVPGVAGIRRLAKEIRFQYQERELGAQMAMTSKNKEARKAIHDFLAFQIREHRTGDPQPGHAEHQH